MPRGIILRCTAARQRGFRTSVRQRTRREEQSAVDRRITQDATSVRATAAKARTATRPLPKISLRPARKDDYDFAAGLYLDSMKTLLTPLGQWDEDRVAARFRRVFKPEHAKVIRLKG